jgi:hypothetical protein
MDSMQPVLPAERIRIYGIDGSRDGKAQTKIEKYSSIKILDEHIVHQCQEREFGIRWLQGAHPQLGAIIQGQHGYETVQKFSRYKF